jgi:hypothetical protein
MLHWVRTTLRPGGPDPGGERIQRGRSVNGAENRLDSVLVGEIR